MLKKLLLAVAVLLVGLVAVIATRPAEFAIERSAKMSAPADVVYAQLTDFHRWSAWSPWEKLDPAMKRELSGPESGVGASYGWKGNDAVGEGRMIITEAKPDERVAVTLEFFKPFAAVSTLRFTIKPEGDASAVTWRMEGKNDFLGKAVSLVMDHEKLVGRDFERGLASLKALAEAEAKTRAEAPKPEAAAPSP